MLTSMALGLNRYYLQMPGYYFYNQRLQPHVLAAWPLR